MGRNAATQTCHLVSFAKRGAFDYVPVDQKCSERCQQQGAHQALLQVLGDLLKRTRSFRDLAMKRLLLS